MPSRGVTRQKAEKRKSGVLGLSGDERDAFVFYRDRIQKAKQARNQPFRQFDNLTFIDDYYSNEDAINSYLRPKRNDDEVRVVGGTTEKRIESIANELLSFNYQHEIHASDREDLEIEDLGRAFEDIVTRTNQMERGEDLDEEAVFELLTQRALFIEEYVDQREQNGQVIRLPKKRVLSALQVFLGDITMPAYRFDDQPYIVTYERMSKTEADSIFDNDAFPNWKYVRAGMNMDEDVFGPNWTFRLGILEKEEVEIIKYMSAPDREMQIIANGVMLLSPRKAKIPWSHPGYNVKMVVVKRMGHHFAYGRPPAAALKYLQALDDEIVRNLIRKFRQAVAPPQGVATSNHVYSKDIFEAGKITYGISRDAFQKLVDHNGVTEAEIAVLQIVKEMQNELAGRSALQLGLQPQKKQTATASIQQQQQAMKMLGLAILAWTRAKREMTWLRIFNVVENFLEPTGKERDPLTSKLVDAYRQWTLRDAKLENERKGTRIINLYHRNLEESEEESLLDFEEKADGQGQPLNVVYLNAKALKNLPVTWYVSVSSKPKEDDDLHKLMFSDKMEQSKAIMEATQRPLNADRVIEEFQRTWRVKDWFQAQPPQAQSGTERGGITQEQGGDVRGAAQEMLAKLEGLGGSATAGMRATAGRRPARPEPTLENVATR